ncbi:fimbrial protein YehD [Escherichia sp. E4385]|uniref:fimbrial protein YehD n=1 Tax=Escherichia sp. E4385 TaxID=2040639 RepID=UPI0010FE33AE|nr:fimbrial protein YehD [Escherichia sp. E4385]TLJ04530.1 fimbrial protein YehD [Escherichia sp. E4385]
MKRSIIAVAVLSSLFMSAGAFAEEGSEQGELVITGNIVGTTCQFIGNSQATIAMNDIGEDQFKDQSAGFIYNGYSNKTTVPLTVKCSEGKTPRITFSRSQFDANRSDITINTAANPNGAGFAVYYESADGQSQKIEGDKSIELGLDESNEYTLNFSAKYAQSGDTVTSGPVNSALTMTVVTD